MNRMTQIKRSDIFLVPNLLSISRIIITIPLGYYLGLNTNQSILICAMLLILAGITDFLDGITARLLNQQSLLGLYLDPLADKFMAVILMIELIFTRSFPVWLAVAVMIRDLIILVGGQRMKKEKNFMPYSFLSGKYYFTSLSVLCGCYIINYDFGIILMTIFVVPLMILSLYSYTNRYIKAVKDQTIDEFKDKPLYLYIRTGATLVVSTIFLYRLYIDLLSQYI